MKSKVYWILILCFSGYVVKAQVDDLMITEYIDSQSGNGGAIKIFNPTGDTIDLTSYEVISINNGGTCQSTTSLNGMLAPSEAIVGYFRSYDDPPNNCPPGDFIFSTCGWNGDDHVGIRKGGVYVDMVNNPAIAVGPNVSGTFNGLFKTHLVRQSSNCTRYTSTNGTDPDSWPTNPFTVVPGWDVYTANGRCINAANTFIPSRDTTHVMQVLCAGDSILIDGVYRDTAGMYYESFPAISVCDSVVATQLSLLPVEDTVLSFAFCQGDSVLVNGKPYKLTGTYTDTLAASNGCDSILHISITTSAPSSTNDTLYICPGDSADLFGRWITIPGEYRDTLPTASGICDSVVITQLYRFPVRDTSFSHSICQGDSILFAGNYFSVPGTYRDTSLNGFGCDSISSLVLSVAPTFTFYDTLYTCPGVAVNIHGVPVSSPGEYRDTLMSGNGCDSVLVTQLYQYGVNDSTWSVSLCDGDTILFAGSPVFTSGSYFDTAQTANGCDSVLTLNVLLLPGKITNETIQRCTGDSVLINGVWQRNSGNYREIYTAFNGCDSIWNVSLVFNAHSETFDTVYTCPDVPVLVYGNLVSTHGEYRDTLMSNAGCDSILITQLYTHPVGDSAFTVSICQGEAYPFNGQNLTAAGVYNDTLSNTFGCDSAISLTLNVLPAPVDVVNLSGCVGDTLTVNGRSFTQSGTYGDTATSSLGCDSVTVYEVALSSAGERLLERTFCAGTSVIVNGNAYSTDTAFSYTKPAATGSCDSLINVVIREEALIMADFDYYVFRDGSNQVDFENYSQGTDAYRWDFGDGDSSSNENPIHFYDAPGEYEVILIAKNSAGCADTIASSLLVPDYTPVDIQVPNSFTPNGDGINEEFFIWYSRDDILFEIGIYTRWGQKIYTSNRLDFRWDGTFNGQPCLPGTYTYHISGDVLLHGTITILK